MISRINFRDAAGVLRPPEFTRGRWPENGGAPVPTGALLSVVRLREMKGDIADRLVARYEAKADREGSPAKPDSLAVATARAISADYVPGHCMDHSDPEHLKRAAGGGLFERRAVYSNHFTEPTRSLGSISDAAWDDTKLGKNGVPGVNVYVGIEGDISEAARTVARGVERGYLTRWSLGFRAEYEASHPDEMDGWGPEDFWRLLGTFAKDGSLYRFVCTEILDVLELSVVDEGAIESARTLRVTDETATPKPARLRGSHVAPSARRLMEIAR